MEKNKLMKLILDNYEGKLNSSEFSSKEVEKSIRDAIIEFTGGSNEITPKDLMEGRSSGLFALIEDIITEVAYEALKAENPLFNYFEEHNLAEGDTKVFKVKKNSRFVATRVAKGVASLRRQRLHGAEEISVDLEVLGIKFYEEFSHYISGKIDINELISKVAEALQRKVLNMMYETVTAAFTGLPALNKKSGSFAEDKLDDLITRVETNTGEKAIIIGTKKALGKITGIKGADSNTAKEDLFKQGYYGTYHGTPVVELKQAYKEGTKEYLLSDDTLYVIASGDKPFKHLLQGDTFIKESNDGSNMDLTVEYLALQAHGFAVAFTDEGFGMYELA